MRIKVLIIWCLFHLLALATCEIPIRGKLQEKGDALKTTSFLFTSNAEGNQYDSHDGFWPFVKYSGLQLSDTDNSAINYSFKGIFYNYNITAFIVYICLGLLVAFLPRLWARSPK